MSITSESKSVYSFKVASFESPKICTTETPNEFNVARLVSIGGAATNYSRVQRYRLSPLTSPVRAIKVSGMAQYESFCSLHKDCYGHLSVTPDGIVMVPSTLAKKTDTNINLYNQAAEECMRPNKSVESKRYSYGKALQNITLCKTGLVRKSIVSGAVEGSLRMVIVSDWRLQGQQVSLPKTVIHKLKYASPTNLTTGNVMGSYSERVISEGDLRPPSLSRLSAQPCTVVSSELQCIGMNPAKCSQCNADFDGDEMQLYPLANKRSIDQCNSWFFTRLISEESRGSIVF